MNKKSLIKLKEAEKADELVKEIASLFEQVNPLLGKILLKTKQLQKLEKSD